MFSLFKPKSPLEPWEKAWAEERLCRMAVHFDMSMLLETPTLVPHDHSIPSAENESAVADLLSFLASWMRLDRKTHAQLFSDSTLRATIDSPPRDTDSIAIRVHEGHLHDRQALIAVITRQLAQIALTDTSLDGEAWAADLFPVFCGLGIFAANVNVRETGKSDGISWWTSLQRGYLPARIFGYAIALREYARSQSEIVDWADLLRPDAAIAFRDGMLYLEKTGDSVFSRELLTRPRAGLTKTALLDEIRSASPSRKIAAMWGLSDRMETEHLEFPQAEECILDCLRHKHADVRAVAASTLPRFSTSAESIQDLIDALKDRSDKVRIAAAASLGTFVDSDQESMIIDELTDALKDDARLVVFNAATSLAAFGQAAQPALKMLLKRLRRSLNQCNEVERHTLLWAIDTIAPDTLACLTEFFGESDSDYLSQSTELLSQLRHAEASAA